MGGRPARAFVFGVSAAMLDDSGMAGLPMAYSLEIEEILPVREYERFAQDVKARWK